MDAPSQMKPGVASYGGKFYDLRDGYAFRVNFVNALLTFLKLRAPDKLVSIRSIDTGAFLEDKLLELTTTNMTYLLEYHEDPYGDNGWVITKSPDQVVYEEELKLYGG